MRPFPGDGPPPRRSPRGADLEPPTAFHHPAAGHQQQITSYFIGGEDAVDAALQQSLASFTAGSRDYRKAGSADAEPSNPAKHTAQSDRESISTLDPADADDISLMSDTAPSRLNLPDPTSNLSQPMTPLMLATPGSPSAISDSMSASFSEEIASQALSLSQDLEAMETSEMMDSGSAPQLVMPSIKMPSRRPFTDGGRRIGRLKVLVAGDSGVGKTSLIKALVQSCEHIVHVDPIAPQSTALLGQNSSPRRGRSKSSRNNTRTTEIAEIFASTKPYPEWWSDLDDFQLLKRRKSVDDTILDRNICFIDTPGYSDGASSMESITPVIRYVESHFEKVQSNASPDAEMLNMLELKPADIKYLQLLASLTNVIPLVAKADNMTPEDVAQSKAQIRSELMEAGVRPFSFTVSSAGIFGDTEPKYPYAVSSTPGSDHDIMDASLLMSPDYVQPLMQSELAAVVDQVFCENGASWLRHAAAKKFIQWKNADNPSRPRALYKPMGLPGSPSMPLVTAGTFSSPVGATSQYSLARIADHTQREERLAQIRLANWASELQRSLANERARYDALARGERAIWLTEKLHECVQDGELVPFAGRDRSDSRLGEKTRRRSGRGRYHSTSTTQSQDPLGLLRVAARVKANGWIALEVLGGVGILGGAAVWLSGQEWPAIGWAVDQWSAFWGGER
ncbi:hypothetical protein INS49_006099 [Diaporthe citri]|uniref:uncharacterized protein n=1 Tax=Diaporthe citri TaxID=83186 RepID=UPI001C823662|nr:uncharacterized protein INS49_006099 [Diaporthe citri]KAG6364498.1 hypothetical protein INS49_006099 [Diaporthe citri]